MCDCPDADSNCSTTFGTELCQSASGCQGGAQQRLRDDAKKAAAADVPETEGADEDAATKARRKKRIRARKLVKALER